MRENKLTSIYFFVFSEKDLLLPNSQRSFVTCLITTSRLLRQYSYCSTFLSRSQPRVLLSLFLTGRVHDIDVEDDWKIAIEVQKKGG